MLPRYETQTLKKLDVNATFAATMKAIRRVTTLACLHMIIVLFYQKTYVTFIFISRPTRGVTEHRWYLNVAINHSTFSARPWVGIC